MLPGGSRSDGVPSYVGATKIERVAKDGKYNTGQVKHRVVITPNQSGGHC